MYALQAKKKDQYLIVPGHSNFKPLAQLGQSPFNFVIHYIVQPSQVDLKLL